MQGDLEESFGSLDDNLDNIESSSNSPKNNSKLARLQTFQAQKYVFMDEERRYGLQEPKSGLLKKS